MNHVDSRVFTRNVTEGRTDAWTDGRTVALLYPFHKFVGEGITMYKVWSKSIEGCDVDSRVFTRMLLGKHLTLWPWKSKGWQIFVSITWVSWNPLNHVDSRVFTRNVTEGRTDARMDGRTVALLYPLSNFVGEAITML